MDKKPKLLIFNDDALLSAMYEKRFNVGGFEVKIVDRYTPQVADLVAEEQPDIIACDIAMPGIDGYDAVKIIKADSRVKNIPVVFFTNMGESEDMKKGMDLGAAAYLVMANTPPKKAVQIFKELLIESGKFTAHEFQ